MMFRLRRCAAQAYTSVCVNRSIQKLGADPGPPLARSPLSQLWADCLGRLWTDFLGRLMIWTDLGPTSKLGRLWANFGPPFLKSKWGDFGPTRSGPTLPTLDSTCWVDFGWTQGCLFGTTLVRPWADSALWSIYVHGLNPYPLGHFLAEVWNQVSMTRPSQQKTFLFCRGGDRLCWASADGTCQKEPLVQE